MAATPEHAARVLGLSLGASLDDVRSVRRKMALKYHPDRSPDQARSTRHMARINAAADTLIAHIKNHRSRKPKAPRADHPDGATHKRAEQSSTRSEAPKRKASPPRDEADTSKRAGRPHGHGQDICVAGKSEQPNKASRADIALIRFASTSYTNALDRIGRKENRSTIDMCILSFQGA